MKKNTIRKALVCALLTLLCCLLFCSCGLAAQPGAATDATSGAKSLEEVSAEELTALESAALEKEATSTGLFGLSYRSGLEGFWDLLKVPFGYLMQVCSFLSGHIYVLALLLFTIAMKVLLFPFGIKQQKGMVKQAKFAPRQKAIQKKYAGRTDKATMQQMQQELMEAQKEAGVSTFGGCLPLLIQFPVLLCLYNVIRMPLRYMAHLSSARVSALQVRALTLPAETLGDIATAANTQLAAGRGLSAAAASVDQLKLIPVIRANFAHFADLFDGSKITSAADLPNFGFFGLQPDLSATPSLSPITWLIVIPILTFLAYFFSMKLTRKFTYQPPVAEGQPDAAASMKVMDWMMPLFSVYISFQVPAGLAIYWIYSSILGVVQQVLLKKMYPYPVFTDAEYKEAERIYNGKAAKKKPAAAADPNRPKPRSLHHIDDDDDDIPESVLNAPVSTKYGDEDEISADKPATKLNGVAVEPAPIKDNKDK